MRAPTPNLISILANTSLFRMLSERQLADLAAKTTPMRMSPNSCIVNQGDPAEGTFWLVYGQVKVGVYSKQGSAKILAILGPGKCFGLGEMMLEQPHLAFVKTTADSMLLHVGRAAMMAAAEENFEFARELMGCLWRQFYGLVRDIGAYSMTARQRLASYLLRQGEPGSDSAIELVANKSLIASRLNVTPETLSRLLRDFVAEGLIEVAGRRVRVLDWAAMSALVA
jgi:CRP-like cAMP-binding protein